MHVVYAAFRRLAECARRVVVVVGEPASHATHSIHHIYIRTNIKYMYIYIDAGGKWVATVCICCAVSG